MGREDLILRLLADLNLRARPSPPSKNTALDKFSLPNEAVGLTEFVMTLRAAPADMHWAGYVGDMALTWVPAGWTWGAGQWR